MATTKAAGAIFLAKLLKARGPEAEKAFLAKFTPEEIKTFQAAIPITRLDIDLMAKYYNQASAILYPNDSKGVWRIGHAMAKDNFTGMYKFILSIATVPFLVKQVAAIWQIYYDKGKPHAENPKDQKLGMVVVEDFPDMPLAIRVLSAGFIQSTLEFTSVKNIQVRSDDSNPQAWKWIATWE